MARGRKKLPTALKVLQGTARKSREHTPGMKEPEPTRSALREPPVNFTEKEREIWNLYAPELHRKGLITDVDYPQFEKYCINIALVDELKNILERDGYVIMGPLGQPVKHPAWGMMKDAMVLVNKFGSEFGASPAARSRVKIPEPVKENPLRAFLGKR